MARYPILPRFGMFILALTINTLTMAQSASLQDSDYFTFTRIYHAERVLHHLQAAGPNQFTLAVPSSPVDYSAPGIQHLLAIADLRTTPAIITLPEQFAPYRSIQVIDLNYQQIFYQDTTEGQFKYILKQQDKPSGHYTGKLITTKSQYVMVLLRTLSWYPEAIYSAKQIRQQINLSGFSEGFIGHGKIPTKETDKASSPTILIQWLLAHHQYSPIETLWLQHQQERFNENTWQQVEQVLRSQFKQTHFWHNLGAMSASNDPQYLPPDQQALSLMFNYPSVAASNRLEISQRMNQETATRGQFVSGVMVQSQQIPASLWAIDSLPVDLTYRQFRHGYHNFNTSMDYRGITRFKLQSIQPKTDSRQRSVPSAYPLVIAPESGFLRSYFYQPGYSLMQQAQRTESPVTAIPAQVNTDGH
ncbi:DUF1254 domain-containing protein [Thalassotalea mangrovi]|uniref:DUF1254 domain-containing protein n=1 Tax=Thalassotalea mangrovi TaxID=2572245 RepID=A0A4U1B9K1_9GAMM|nr:DUF1254 domain-containing protein [Thalassotalea mangrovi]TKB47381.1 DUF1254 domain-containing protein [Thalassotalea mangrovi]